MRGPWMMRGVRFVIFAVVAVLVGTAIVMQLWNFLVPTLFSGPTLHFGQALGLLVLSRILLGRMGSGFGHRMHWRHRMQERWQQMSPEEREQFRGRFGGRCGFGGASRGEPAA